MYPRTLAWGLALLFVAGCASQPPSSSTAANDPTNPNAPEAPLPPVSTSLASTSADQTSNVAPTEPPMNDMHHGMDGMKMDGMKMDGMKMDGKKEPNK